MVLVLGLMPAPADGQTETGFLTAVNALTESVDVYIDGQMASIRLEPSRTGREFSVPVGPHTVEFYPTGSTARDANLLGSTEADVVSASGTSVIVWGDPDSTSGVGVDSFPDPGLPSEGDSCLVLRHLAAAGSTRLLIDGEPDGDHVSQGFSTRAIPVAPGLHDLGLDGVDTTPAQVNLTPGSCAAIHAVGDQDVIVNLLVQSVAARGDERVPPPSSRPAQIEVINGLRGLSVDFVLSDETLTLEPLSASTTTAANDLDGRFVDPDGVELGDTAVDMSPGSDLTVVLHGDTTGAPTVTSFDNSSPNLDENTACIEVRVLSATGGDVGVAIENGPALAGLRAGDTTGTLGIDPGPTAITAGPSGEEITHTRDLEGGTCLYLYLVDTTSGPQLVSGAELADGLASETDAEVAGRQETLPVTGWGDSALPLILFALGVMVFGLGLVNRTGERSEIERPSDA
ncbi:MAG: DUF4397 domain-containing protein [Actinomycetia bacterium]|nr:DUF4397 domain-containing protein [Actinomycetes bacterium]